MGHSSVSIKNRPVAYRQPQYIHFLRTALLLSLLILSGSFRAPAAEQDHVNLKILAINPSESKELDTEIVHLLPPEIMPDNIVDKAGLEVRYDQEQKAYYLSGQVKLAPKETRTIIVQVQDVWKITPEKMEEIRAEITRKFEALKGTKFEATGEILYQKSLATLDQIQAEQDKTTGIRKRIEVYRAHIKQIEEIREDALTVGGIRRLEKSGEEIRTAKFRITAENPGGDSRTMTIRADLPKEITADDIVDRQGFSVLFDQNKNRFVLEKQDEFGPNETKNFDIVIRDIWYITQSELDYVRDQASSMAELFTKSDYSEYAAAIHGEIDKMLDQIQALQEEVGLSSAIQDRIRAFILNKQKMAVVKQRIRELQDLLLELPMKVEADDPFMKRVSQGIREFQKVDELYKLLTMGFEPDLSTTWWIILIIIGFVMMVSTVFYLTWLGKLKQYQYDKQAEEARRKGG